MRVSPGGSVIHLGSLDSLARLKVDSRHPVIAHEEKHNAAKSRHVSVCRKIVRIVDTPAQSVLVQDGTRSQPACTRRLRRKPGRGEDLHDLRRHGSGGDDAVGGGDSARGKNKV